jgi:hypothetical protein
MLENPKNMGDRVGICPFGSNEPTIQGTVSNVEQRRNSSYYYQVAWDDGQMVHDWFSAAELQDV